MCVGNGKKPTRPKNPIPLRNIKLFLNFCSDAFRRTKRPNNHTGQTGQNAKFVLNNGGPNGSDGSKRQIRVEQWGGQTGQTGQNAKFVLNNGGPNGSDGSKRQIRAEQWGGQTGQTGQNAKFVLNNGGAKWARRVKTPNSC